jgi:hypothetical protein
MEDEEFSSQVIHIVREREKYLIKNRLGLP